jgi:DNA-binding response OmpR family regulator
MPVSLDDRTANVVVVDDEESLADLYATWLSETHSVDTAYGGQTALERITETTDIVFLDRQMPGHSGDAVLDAIDERGLDCRVVMVTAVDPGFDIVEMPFDDYLTKPVNREDLETAVTEMLRRDSYDGQIQEYFSLVSKKATLESEKTETQLAESDAYADIQTRLAELSEQVDTTATEFESARSLFSDIRDPD